MLDVVLLVGGYGQAWHLGADNGATLTETVARWRTMTKRKGQPRYWPLPHPSWRNTGWLKKNPWFEAELLPALQKNVARVLRSS